MWRWLTVTIAARSIARCRLLQLFQHTLSSASPTDSTSILSIPKYSPLALKKLLDTAHLSGADRYHDYLARRKSGCPREIFPTKAHAKEWIRQAACVKYVDGGWVAGILLNPTSRERASGKMAWQVISEEFGDGDLAKNHVKIYHQLMDKLSLGGRDPAVGRTLGGADKGFDGLPSNQGVPRCWSAALAQQCIGLLASEFYAESLGFNMAYETLPYHLLVTSYELRELNIDDSYFALHVTIDNPDSGHAAMARLAVESYLDQLGSDEERRIGWRRVQSGMVLADGLPTTPWSPIEFERTESGKWSPRNVDTAPIPPRPDELAVAELFVRKSVAARRMHCPSRLRIQGNTLEEWLDPSNLTISKSINFVRALQTFRPWVKKGDADSSKLVESMGWGGRMFGAFSRGEVEVIRSWIDNLGNESQPGIKYCDFAQRSHTYTEDISDFDLSPIPWTFNTPISPHMSDHQTTADLLAIPLTILPGATATTILKERIGSLWLASTLILDHFPLSPAKLASPLGMTMLRLIRSQLGCPALHRPQDICAGLDDHPDSVGADSVGLWEIGEHLLGQSIDLQALADKDASEVQSLLGLRLRPYENQAVLAGLALGFTKLYTHPVLVEMISDRDSAIAKRISHDMREALEECIETKRRSEQKGGDDQDEFWQGVMQGNLGVQTLVDMTLS